MIYAYGITQRGAYHIKNGTVCQDAHKIIKNPSVTIAAVADGLGSELYADIASRIAADVSTDYCAERVTAGSSEEDILAVIRTSFSLSQKKIEEKAAENGHDPDQYDTTLTLAVLIDGDLYYGQSGDSGIIAFTEDGMYNKVTEQQRDNEGRVFPLFFGEEKWVFARYGKKTASVLLATDGMLEIFFPVYIQHEKVNIYTALARYFMDPRYLKIADAGEEEIQEKRAEFVADIRPEQVNDDKTIVALMDDAVEVTYQPEDYYAEPDWAELQRKYEEAWRREAYPSLYHDEETQSDEP